MSTRGLVVLADGVQAAFCAGVVAQLAASGWRWAEAAGAGLGSQVALLALLGEAEEGARRFARLAQEGAALFRPALGYAREAVSEEVFLVLPDPFRLAGWLSPSVLAEYLAPEQALAGRVKLWVCLEDLTSGSRGWRELENGDQLARTAAFPWGWPPVAGDWGGVGACAEVGFPPLAASQLDVVCGFPVPPAERPGLGHALFATVQRREEIAAAHTVARWATERPGLRVFAPTQEHYALFVKREGALLGAEYPLPVEHNAELLGTLVAFGRFVAEQQGG